MSAYADMSIRVTSFNRQPLEGAQVTVERDGRTMKLGTTDARGRFRVDRDDSADLMVRVEAEGYATQERAVTGDRPERVELFILGRTGMPFYYRGNVRVPFEPVENAVGVLLRQPEDAAAQAAQVAERFSTRLVRSHENFDRSAIAIVGVQDDAAGGGAEALLEELSADQEIEQAGALVQLFENNASFLTSTVIARFADDIDDAQVAAIAQRHGLTISGRIEALGNVYRMSFDGPASYAVLDASNGLAEEPDVVYAEPDLVHTVEEDRVTPTDFLFRQQWDHPIIDTPGAWQALQELDRSHSFGSPDVTIAVVDSGVDTTHPEFAGNVSNGQPKVYRVFDFANMVANMDSLGGDHGTACASAATASANNASAVPRVSEGLAGVAGNCRLLAVRRGGTELRYAEMYLWAGGLDPRSSTPNFPAQITPGADVITSSFGFSVGSPISALMSDTFDALTDQGRDGAGTLLFFSAGNSNSDLDLTFARPWGMYDRCFCVAASTLADDGVTEIKAGYSSFGSTVDFCAPSMDNDGASGAQHNPPRTYGAQAATIQASPSGHALPGRPDRTSTLSVVSPAGASMVTVASATGMAVGQAMLLGAPGVAGTESRLITAVNAAMNRITVTPGLSNAHAAGTVVASGPRSYQSNFGGTSYSTPICAGTGALMLSVNPRLRWHQVRDLLRETAVKIDPNNTDPAGRWRDGAERISTDPNYAGPVFSEFYGFGRIDARAAVLATSRCSIQELLTYRVDLTGDGTADVVGFGNAGVWVSLNNGDGTFQIAKKVVDNFGYEVGNWRVDKHPRFLADLTGDGTADVVGFGNAGVWVSLNNGDGTFQIAKKVVDNFGYEVGNWRVDKHPRFLADLTGDGTADVVGFGNAGVWVSLNNGDGTFQIAKKVVDNFGYEVGNWRVDKHPRFLADLTGDGTADVVGFGNAGVWVSLNNGDGTFQIAKKVVDNFGYEVGNWRVDKHPRFLADLTGDGTADVVGFGNAGVWVSLNNGDGTFQIAKKVVDNFGYEVGNWRVDKHPRFLADLTGDGTADVVGFGNAGVWVSLNNGDGTFQIAKKVVDNFGYEVGNWRVDKHPRFLADLTGDGTADVVGFGNAGVWGSLNNGDGTFQIAKKVVDNFGYEVGNWRVDKHPRFLAG